MRMFKDLFSGCTLASDAYPFEELYNGAVIKFKGKWITKSDKIDGIPDAEGDQEGGDAGGISVIDLVDTYNMHSVEGYKVPQWMALVKGIMTKIMTEVKKKGLDQDKMKAYRQGCVDFVNFVKTKFDEIQIYQGEIGEYEGEEQSFGYALNEDENDPMSLSFYFFKDALVEEKY